MSHPGYLGDKKIPDKLFDELDGLKDKYGFAMVLQALGDIADGHSYNCPDAGTYENLAMDLTKIATDLNRLGCRGKTHRDRR